MTRVMRALQNHHKPTGGSTRPQTDSFLFDMLDLGELDSFMSGSGAPNLLEYLITGIMVQVQRIVITAWFRLN